MDTSTNTTLITNELNNMIFKNISLLRITACLYDYNVSSLLSDCDNKKDIISIADYRNAKLDEESLYCGELELVGVYQDNNNIEYTILKKRINQLAEVQIELIDGDFNGKDYYHMFINDGLVYYFMELLVDK